MEVFLFICIYLVKGSLQCSYPTFLQQNEEGNTSHEWHSHITYHSRETLQHYSLATFFRAQRMRVLPYGGQKAKDRPKPHVRECIMQYTDTKYLAKYTEDHSSGAPDKYICMEFIRRSPYVFQLNQSKISEIKDLNLCNNMTLDYWVYVNTANFYHTYTKCPLMGGYNIKMYDKAEETDVCDSYNGETRIEVECIAGEGMTFLFRHAICVPKHLHMHVRQSTYCIASWKQGNNIFTVLRHDKTEHMWCFRQPANHTGAFTAYLFKSLYCDGEELPQTKDHIVIDMVTDTPRGMDKLCMDDYEACSYWSQPCSRAGDVMQLSCAKKCGICSDSDSGSHKRPDSCVLPERFKGKWHVRDDHRVEINESSIKLTDFADLHCVDWDNRRQFPSDAEYIEQMFVATFQNGCRPRYYCSQLKKRSHSVLRFKLSEGQLWPFQGTNGITVDCGGFIYRDDHNIFGNNNYHSQHFKTLTSHLDTVYVDCELGYEKKFEVIFEDGVKCKGSLSQDGLSTVTKMKLSLNKDCPGRQTEQEFACLDSTKHMYQSQQLIVTENLDSMDVRIKCWFFPAFPEDLFYLLSIGDCNEGASTKINTNIIKPVAEFQIMNDIQISIVPVKGGGGNQIVSTQTKREQSPQSIESGNPTYTNDMRSPRDKSVSTPEKDYFPDEIMYIDPNNNSNKHYLHVYLIMSPLCALLLVIEILL